MIIVEADKGYDSAELRQKLLKGDPYIFTKCLYYFFRLRNEHFGKKNEGFSVAAIYNLSIIIKFSDA